MKESWKECDNCFILVGSLGWRVSSEWIAKDFKIMENLKIDPKAFFLVEDHHLIRF